MSWGHPSKRRLIRGAILAAMVVLLTGVPAGAQESAETSVSSAFELLDFGKSWS